ncbi:MAG: ABC transporter ATP-binding protein [bacterium]|nr:ABC transporter ATP-binding protein [bacterium]
MTHPSSPITHNPSLVTADTAIRVEHVSKKYCKSLKRSMLYGMKDIAKNTLGLSSHSEKLRKDEFWALNDISFEVKKGETLGIIGPNGSGKTTLLKLLNGIFWPDKGKITVRGRVGALIAVGAGFHPMLTGRENIYINGAILGMGKKEIDEKFDEIVAFADIGDFLDTPVKFYSSGMFVRLGFAIAVHCEPDILLVDEVLAVGDFNFQDKCVKKIDEFRKEEKTIVIVSHDKERIRNLCSEAVCLHRGKIVSYGDTNEVLDYYYAYIKQEKTDKIIGERLYKEGKKRIKKKLEIVEVATCDEDRNQKGIFDCGDPMTVRVKIKANRSIDNSIVACQIYREDGILIHGASTYRLDLTLNVNKGKSTTVEFHYEKLNILEGNYYLKVFLMGHWLSPMRYDEIEQACFFIVKSELAKSGLAKSEGLAYIPCKITGDHVKKSSKI